MLQKLTLPFFVLILLLGFAAPTQGSNWPCEFEIVDGSQWNSKLFKLNCESTVEGWVTVDFGDGDTFDLEVPDSGVTPEFPHDFPWTEQFTTYILTAMRLVGRDQLALQELTLTPPAVVEETKIMLPLVMRLEDSSASAYCSIEISGQNINHVIFDVTWIDAGEGIHQVNFGDGTMDEQFFGSTGSGQTWHDYPWPEDSFIAEMQLDGGGSCQQEISISWP